MSDIKETIYYKELRAGDIIQKGDEWWPKDGTGQWQAYHQGMFGLQVLDASIARRPIRATHQTTFEEVPGTRTLQQAVEQPQPERWAYEELQPGDVTEAGDQWQNSDGRWHALVLIPGASAQVRDDIRARRPHNITRLQTERDKTRAEVTQLQAERQEWIDRCNAESVRALRLSERLSAAEVAVKSAQRARDELQRQVDELRADRRGETTARQVQEVLRRWATELEWSADCFGTGAREQVHGVQNTLIAVMQRIESMFDAEGSRAND